MSYDSRFAARALVLLDLRQRAPRPSLRAETAVLCADRLAFAAGDCLDELREACLGLVVSDLAGPGRFVPTAVVGKHQRADVQPGGAVENRAPDSEHRVLLSEAPQHVDRHSALRIHRVQEEAVSGV